MYLDKISIVRQNTPLKWTHETFFPETFFHPFLLAHIVFLNHKLGHKSQIEAFVFE